MSRRKEGEQGAEVVGKALRQPHQDVKKKHAKNMSRSESFSQKDESSEDKLDEIRDDEGEEQASRINGSQ